MNATSADQGDVSQNKDKVHTNKRKSSWVQLAGHPGSFEPVGQNRILKKRAAKENTETVVYQQLMKDVVKDLVPEFHKEVETNGEFFIEMQDLLQEFTNPNILDIKMGTRTFLESEVSNPKLREDLYQKMIKQNPDEPTAEEKEKKAITKLRYMQFRENDSSSSTLGFRCEAIKMSSEQPNTDLKKVKSKQQVLETLTTFLQKNEKVKVKLLQRLKDIRSKFESSKFFKNHEIVGSSLLFLYDKHNNAGIWMIDFAKTIEVKDMAVTHRTPWKAGNHEDGYLLGLDALIQVFQDIKFGNERRNSFVQLAGHPGSFEPVGQNRILKKRAAKENTETVVYQQLMKDVVKDLVPEFHKEVETNGEYFIEMQDLIQLFTNPNILDIKMGTRTFLESEVSNPKLREDLYQKMIKQNPNEPTADEKEKKAITKLRYMQFREKDSSSASLGFRCEAIRMSGEQPNTYLKKIKTKDEVKATLTTFLQNNGPVKDKLLQRLLDIRSKFESSPFFKKHEIIGSSLLFLYDKNNNAGVWMIDFAKTIEVQGLAITHRSPWKAGNHEDGFLYGLDSLIQVVHELSFGSKVGERVPSKQLSITKSNKNSFIQLAGHPGSFQPIGEDRIWKKRSAKDNTETVVYQQLMKDVVKDLVPEFHKEVESDDDFYIEMQDLLKEFTDPNILDIKMGIRTFLESEVKNPVLRKDLYDKMVKQDPDEPTDEEKEQKSITKLRYMQFREKDSSSGTLGFRCEAIKMSGEKVNSDLKKVKSKLEVEQTLATYLQYSEDIKAKFIIRLKDIRSKFESSEFFQNHEIVGSSLLFLFDRDNKAGIWMIDFAKTKLVEDVEITHRRMWEVGNHEDGYLFGLDCLIQLLQELNFRKVAAAPPIELNVTNTVKPLEQAVDAPGESSSKMPQRKRKTEWVQLAGHTGQFAPAGPYTIWKKRLDSETTETIVYQRLMYDIVKDLIPQFYLELEYNGNYFIEMQDLLQGFTDPNILDIKMGSRTFQESEAKKKNLRKDLYDKMIKQDPDEPTDEENEEKAITKLRYMQFRERDSSTSTLGFRCEAVRMSGEKPNTDLKKVKSRQQVEQSLSTFLQGNEDVRYKFIKRLKDIKTQFEASPFFSNHEIIGSSLLFLHDKSSKAGVWMIDFAKTTLVEGMILSHRRPWQMGNHEDGYLFGLDSLIKIFQELDQKKTD